ncbi:MAG: hypothetical protein JO060_00670 [Candidatus Eremiobacteraeota bacterium]|nr:hypothetical protein [Candidatus Eremiobacteraeota bacterium]
MKEAAPRSRSWQFAFGVIGAALAVGAIAVHRAIAEPGIIGLYHDWTIPPDGDQIVTYAKQLTLGWHSWGLGAPVNYPAEYPYWFAAAALAWLGLGGAAFSKAVALGAPALAFACAVGLGRALGMSKWGSFLCGLVYALSPVMLNKLVAGQVTYLFGYALLPLVPVVLIVGLRRAAPWRWGIVLGGLIGIVAMQVQLGAVAMCVAVVALLVCSRVTLRRRTAFLAATVLTLAAVEYPTLLAIALNRSVGVAVATTANAKLAWLYFNSVAPLDALRLIGYATNYDRTALGDWYAPWSVVAYVIALCAVAGLWTAPPAIRWAAALLGGAAFLLVTGAYSLIAPILVWAFSSIPLAQAFRELYHLMAVLALLYAAGIGFFADSALLNRYRFGPAVLVLFATVFVSPMLSGDCGGQLAAHPYDREMTAAYREVHDAPGRVVWFPMDQPLAYRGFGAGVEPMAVLPGGSLWMYILGWPLSAVDMDARAANWNAVREALDVLGVRVAVARPDFSSRLWDFAPVGEQWHYYLERPVQVPPLSLDATAISPSVTMYGVRALPLAFASGAGAIVPQRVGAIAALGERGLVPFPFGAMTTPPFPYVVVRDPHDTDDEILAGRDEIPFSLESQPRNNGFAPLADLWFLGSAFADANGGVVALGRQRLDLPLRHEARDGVLEIAWIATPLGGRVRVVAGGRTVILDTQATSVEWRSALVHVGRVWGGSVSLQTLDGPGVVAIRRLRLIESAALPQARRRYAELLRHATGVFAWRAGASPAWKALRTGTSWQLGTLTTTREYRLRVSSVGRSNDVLVIAGPKDFEVAFVRLPRHGGEAVTQFAGLDAALHLATASKTPLRWSLESRPLIRPGAIPETHAVIPNAGIVAGTFDGARATIPNSQRIAVLNVNFGTNWVTQVKGARHLTTALGTNAWILPRSRDGATSVSNVQARAFLSAFVVGGIALLLTLGMACALTLPLGRTATRRTRATAGVLP